MVTPASQPSIHDLEALRLEIAEAEHRLRLVLDAAGVVGGWDWDIATKTLRGDAAFASLMQLDPVALAKGVPAYNFFSNVHPDDNKRLRLAVAGIMAGAEVFAKDYRLTREDGGIRWVHARGRAILGSLDEPVRFVGSLVDVTEQKRIQERLRVAQTAGRIGTFEHAEGYGTVAVSEQFCLLLGLHPTRVLPVSTVNMLVHPEDRPIIEPMLPNEPKPDNHIEFRITRADTGEPRWLARRGEYVRNLSGPGLSYIGVAYDITAAKLTEERLRRLNESLSERVRERTRDRDRIWQNSRDLLAVLNSDGVIVDANPAWQFVLGQDGAALVGRNVGSLLLPQDAEILGQGLAATLANGGASFETRLMHADGTLRWISWTTSREADAIYAYGRHTTVEREQEAALREAEAQLRQSQKMEAVGQLTGGLAHDFNNMLTGIMGSLDIIKRRIASGRLEGLDRFMDAATISAQRAAALTHRLLAFSRRQSLDRKPTDLAQLVSGMKELLERTLGEQVRLSVAPAADTWLATTDANQLENALLNLAINARDAMPAGGLLRIETRNRSVAAGEVGGLEVQGQQDFVAISVRDTGSGMSPEVLEKVFDPFFTTKPIGQGTGLGLSMVYGFLQQSGGGVHIESAVGQGTTITLFLPRSVEGDREIETVATGDTPEGAGEKVLLVEDDPSVRLLVAEVLSDLGYSPVQVTNANAALQELNSGAKFDLLISDVGLPGMNGRQLAEIARQQLPQLKILFITGYAATALERGEFLGEGMDLISKPFDLEQLGRKISSMLVKPPGN